MKKLLLLLSAFALVMGLSQCRKPNMPVLNIGETQHVVLNASWDNGGAKLVQDVANLKWKVGDSLMVSGGAEGKLYCSFPDGTFEGNIKKISKDKITFTFKSKYYREDFKGQSGELNDAVMLLGESEHIASGKYNVSMTMPHAVLLLNLSAFADASTKPDGVAVEITAAVSETSSETSSETVASVAGVTTDSKNVYVAVKVDETPSTKSYKFSGNGKVASCKWTLKTNAFYTLLDGEDPTGDAIVITP
ncbi:MAG: hypothetical protein MJZ78_03845 [Bacteroidales bacterium]|nr:hypothetical protein [Bacteroidales bacterium]